jgi:hypothetical protein
MAREGVNNEEYWKRVIEDYVASGIGQKLYCQEHKVSKASLYKWSRQLGISLSKQSRTFQNQQTDRNDKQTNTDDKEVPISFIELNVLSHQQDSPLPLKLELLLTHDRKVRIETAAGWESVVVLVKTLVS